MCWIVDCCGYEQKLGVFQFDQWYLLGNFVFVVGVVVEFVYDDVWYVEFGVLLQSYVGEDFCGVVEYVGVGVDCGVVGQYVDVIGVEGFVQVEEFFIGKCFDWICVDVFMVFVQGFEVQFGGDE